MLLTVRWEHSHELLVRSEWLAHLEVELHIGEASQV